MRTRMVYLQKDKTFTAAQTLTSDINIADPISAIDIIVEMTNGSAMTEASVVKPHDEFTGIVVRDGSDILVSGSMEEFQALNFYETGQLPFMELTLDDDDVQRELCRIHFGKDLGDPNHYLRPSDWLNLQIELTNAFTTAGVTAWAAAGHNINIIAHVFDEAPGDYRGFLSAKSMYTFTAVDGAIEVIDLPRDHPYRLMVIQALATGASPILSLEKLKISVDADKYIPVEIESDHLLMQNAMQFGKAHQNVTKRITGTGAIYLDLYHLVEATLSTSLTLTTPNLITIAGENCTAESYDQT